MTRHIQLSTRFFTSSKERIFTVCILIATLSYISFVFLNNKQAQILEEKRINQHTTVISDFVWNLDSKNLVRYLTQVSSNYNYGQVNIIYEGFPNLQKIVVNGAKLDQIDRFLESINLIKVISFKSDIYHRNQKIGSIQFLWNRKTIYTQFYVLLVLLLTLVIIQYILQHLENKSLLETDLRKRLKAEAEKKELQKQLFQSSRLASIGELSAGVGHEINNPLMIIIGSIELLSDHLESTELLDDFSKQIINNQEKAANRIADIVKNLRNFSRADDDIIEPVVVKDVIKQSLSFLSKIYFKEGISITTDFGDRELAFWGNKGKFQQVIINLLSNAKDALFARENKKIKIKTYNEADRIIISISDNGTGISPTVLPKIFDSFFTTKEVGKGTGLGLSISRSIIENLKGTINVQTRIHNGTTFTIQLPKIQQSFHLDSTLINNKVAIPENKFKGRALVIDDEESIRMLFKKMLQKLGLNVDLAKSGSEGLLMLKKSEYKYVFTDLVHPGTIKGEQIINKIKDTPEFLGKIFVITGFTPVETLHLPVDGFINKPFYIKDIYNVLKMDSESNPS